MHDEHGIYFPSERSRLLGILLWSPFLAIPYAMLTGGPWLQLLIGMSVGIVLVPWLWFGTGYRVTSTRLIVRTGPMEYEVPLSSIRSVRRTWNPLAGPALSLRRLAIRLDTGQLILISPANRDRFIALLRERCPQAQFEV
ncbi:MAG TPA: PH domain-containing protein [Thermaerobacter sp.]